jgi:hypothetical protein
VRYEDEDGQSLEPSARYGRNAPSVDGVDQWSGNVACDLAWTDGTVGRYWRVLSRDAEVTRLEFVA